MTNPIDEAAVLAEMTVKLEAEGMAASEAPMASTIAGRIAEAQAEQTIREGRDVCADGPWHALQQPASLAYLRELVQMARESGMTYIRTGNLEMKFDTDARKPAATGDNRTTF